MRVVPSFVAVVVAEFVLSPRLEHGWVSVLPFLAEPAGYGFGLLMAGLGLLGSRAETLPPDERAGAGGTTRRRSDGGSNCARCWPGDTSQATRRQRGHPRRTGEVPRTRLAAVRPAHNLTLARLASLLVAALMALGSAVGLLLAPAGLYGRDPAPVAVFAGQDAANLVVGLPVLLGSVWLAGRGAGPEAGMPHQVPEVR